MDDFAKNYIKLGLRINKHIDGYVEHYYGPSELKRAVDLEEKFSPNTLLNDCKTLMDQIKNQGFEENRRKFLHKNLYSIQTILKKLNGEVIPYLELVEKLFDFKPILYDDEFFYDLSLKAEELYKGKGDISTRMTKFAKKRTIPKSILKTKFFEVLRIARNRTNIIFPGVLPEGERVEVTEVKDQNWSCYCWYQGNYLSRIDINVEKAHYWTHLLNVVCHEVYPGHHTERVIKEQQLLRGKNYFETSILLIYTPEMVISEGIGSIAERVIFEPSEGLKVLLEHFSLNPKKEDTIDDLVSQSKIREGYRRLQSNLAYHKYVNEWSDDKLIEYCNSFKIIPNQGITSMLDFISDDLWAPYTPVYQGERLIIEKFGNPIKPFHFLKLLSEQFLPSELL
ncbi:MAG: hypothetical protein ACFFDB_10160 [Promethearchaeota archaeon]